MDALQSPAYRQLTEIAALPDGWDGEDAERPTAYAIARAFYLIDLVRRGTSGIEPVASMPLPDGGLQIEWQENGRRFEAEIDAEGAVSLLEVDLRGPSQEYHSHGRMGLREVAERIAGVLIGA